MLLKMAEKEMDDSYEKNKVLPVFISFSKAIFVDIDKDILFFKQWMLSKILFELRVKLKKHGIGMSQPSIFGSLFGCSDEVDELSDKLNSFITVMEETWRKKDDESNERLRKVFGIEPERIGVISDVDYFKKLIEELCEYYDIERVVLLFDEACHNFIPIQQREFFTFFRDLRTPYISCKAAVYPCTMAVTPERRARSMLSPKGKKASEPRHTPVTLLRYSFFSSAVSGAGCSVKVSAHTSSPITSSGVSPM